MAAASCSVPSPKPTDDDEFNSDKFVLCPVCLDYYDDPKLLPCAHVVCCKCLLNCLRANPMSKRCPICRGDITEESFCRLPDTLTPEEICQELPTDVSMVELVKGNRQLTGPHECGKCGNEANKFCLHCYLKLCGKCSKKHTKYAKKEITRAKASREAVVAKAGMEDLGLDADHPNIPYVAPKQHKIELLSSLTQMRIGQQRVERCSTHTGKNGFQVYYCNTHEKGLCVQCVREEHSQCEIVTADAKLSEQLEVLAEQRRRLEFHQELLREEGEMLTQKEEEMRKKSVEVQAEVDRVMDGILNRMKQARAKLKDAMEGLEGMPPEEKARQQASLLREFRTELDEMVNMDMGEAAVGEFVESGQQTVRDVRNRCAALQGRGPQCPRTCVHHPHHSAHHSQQQQLRTETQAVPEDQSAAVQEPTTSADESSSSTAADAPGSHDADTPSAPPPPSQ